MAMAETLMAEGTVDSLDIGNLRGQLKELSENMRIDAVSTPETYSDSKNMLEDSLLYLQDVVLEIESEDQVLASSPEDSETYLKQLKEELHLVEEESTKIDDEIVSLREAICVDSAELDGGLEGFGCSLQLRDLWSNDKFRGDRSDSGSESISDALILDVGHQIEKNNKYLTSLKDLSHVIRRDEAMGQMEDIISQEVLPIEIEGNCIRLLIKTFIPSSDGFLLRRKLDYSMEPFVVDHELLIDVMDDTMELKNLEIFPNDVSLDEVISAAKWSREFFSSVSVLMVRSSFKWLVRKVQQRIFFCTLRHLAVKDANKSRHSFEYSDRDETVTVHLVGGIDAFIKISQGWPVSCSTLELVSIRNKDIHSDSVLSLGFVCKVKELANYLDGQIRQDLPCFADSIEEIIIREMHLQA